jgi:hypothetical protein
MTNKEIYQYTGKIGQTESKTSAKGTEFHRVEMVAPDGATQWFTAFQKVSNIMFASPDSQWDCTYSVFNMNNGGTAYTLEGARKVVNGSGSGPAGQSAPPQQQAQPPVQQAPPAQYTPDVPAWSLNMDERSQSIIRQVAFKAAVDTLIARDGTLEGSAHATVKHITDVYESIILGTYESAPMNLRDDGVYESTPPPIPDEPPQPDDLFSQHQI